MAPELFALRGLSRRVDIRKVAFAPCASMTHRVILGFSNPLTSARERSSWSEGTLSLDRTRHKLQFESFSTAIHSPPTTFLCTRRAPRANVGSAHLQPVKILR